MTIIYLLLGAMTSAATLEVRERIISREVVQVSPQCFLEPSVTSFIRYSFVQTIVIRGDSYLVKSDRGGEELVEGSLRPFERKTFEYVHFGPAQDGTQLWATCEYVRTQTVGLR